jgi:hypothetical protein
LRKGEKRKIYPNDNRDPYKEEIKIPPPHPDERKNINYFSHSKDPYFLSRTPRRGSGIVHGWVAQTELNIGIL